MTAENILEPPKLLAQEREKLGITEEQFGVCDIGETRLF